jgi:hypothetical protein
MFDSNTRYPPQRMKLFLRYLVNAAAKLEQGNRGYPVEYAQHNYNKPNNTSNNSDANDLIEERLTMMSSDRKEELETKINSFYTKNKYLAFEIRLKKIKKQYDNMKKSKGYSKKKLETLSNKIRLCQQILKNIELADKPKKAQIEFY